MRETLRSVIVPGYVLLCIMLGGSAQGIWGNMVLQLLAVGIIAWSLLTKYPLRLSQPSKILFGMIAAAVALLLLQIVPLPPAVWQALPGRSFVTDGFALLGQQAPWLPISLAPYETMAAALALLPPVAVLTGMLLAGAYRPGWLALSILVGTLAAVLLGTLQVSSPMPTQSPWYLYERTNHGVATGFFANSNHMATLLVVSIAFLVALVAELRKRAQGQKAGSAVLMLAIAGVMTLLVGIVINGSLAALLLGFPVAAISATMLLSQNRRRSLPVAVFAFAAVATASAIYLTPLHDRLEASNTTSFESREEMWSNTVPAIEDHWLFGSGAGTFPTLYPQYEDQAAVGTTFVNHAHNDYLEIALETGLPGILLLAGFLIWWAQRISAVWRPAASNRYALAATIASAAILFHSLVDYPLRTTALSAIFAACLALMVQPRLRDPNQPADLWSTRHLGI